MKKIILNSLIKVFIVSILLSMQLSCSSSDEDKTCDEIIQMQDSPKKKELYENRRCFTQGEFKKSPTRSW